MGKIALLVISLVGLSNFCTESKFIEGHLSTVEDWAFLTRFCFLSQRGRLEFEFEYPQEGYEPQNLLLYYDDPDQWPAVYGTDKPCIEKESVLKPQNNQVVNLTTAYYWSGCQLISNASYPAPTFVCHASRTFRSSRERWWFLAISHCENLQGLNLKYKITMTNGEDIWHKHFSADEFYILEVDISFLLATFVMFVLSVVVAVHLRNRQLFHTTYKLYMTALVCEVLHLFIMCIAYGKYANDGVDNYGLRTFARVLEAASVLVFLLMLILMAKGYTITRGRLSTSGSIKIAVFMTLYVIVYAVLFIYEANFFDPGKVLYLYESPAGYGLIAMRLLGWIWFCYAIFFTLKHYPEKSKFYYPFFIFYTIWFWAGPIVILIAMRVMNLWVREKVVNGVEVAVTFIGLIFFLILTRPSAANKNFPYHVRTSQIGVMSQAPHTGAPDGASKDTESFASHPYAVSDPPPEYSTQGGPNFTELFTVSNTRSAPQQNGSVDQSMPKENGNTNGHIDKFPHQNPEDNPFIVQR